MNLERSTTSYRRDAWVTCSLVSAARNKMRNLSSNATLLRSECEITIYRESKAENVAGDFCLSLPFDVNFMYCVIKCEM